MMYLEVLETEKKLEQYGRNALRLRSQESNMNIAENSDGRSRGLYQQCKSLSNIFSQHRSTKSAPSVISRSKSTHKKTRHVLYRALSYAMAYLATYLFPMIYLIIRLVNRDKWEPFHSNIFLTLSFVFHPLQGLFNFMVFIYPRVLMAKRKRTHDGKELVWRRAFVEALVWRGGKKGQGGRGKSISHEGRAPLRSRHTKSDFNFETMKKDHINSDLAATQANSNQRRQVQILRNGEEEEEKCEIEGNPCYKSPFLTAERVPQTTR
eukprot:CAMPEP_0204618252 /NCGR_PEP_ID=MMETSP0717-20131115/4965_1 /ASSEMBLY_ACC=CAM_ASM_000666 /TAXON_ID=230516 /ORGANISM="Chaetoceros curvisetus" /LENGTH=264 /DNA_ID=CAMNT_0051631951 /DNA_START=29 /DNA_END=823 /DNA_ORIENTATION=+